MNAPAYHIHLRGIVQGVGFRPLVHQLAGEYQLKGWVCNAPDGLHVGLNADAEAARKFLETLLEKAPAPAHITEYDIQQAPPKTYTGFDILESHDASDVNIPLTPDLALCEDCRRELLDPASRRYQYPFITCTRCGPRYSITHRLPYDRAHTSMHAFSPCKECTREYADISDRRYYSQTNSCEQCGIHLSLIDKLATCIATGNATSLQIIKNKLQQGQIIAIKGIGGFLLLCDASNEQTILQLRQRKHRPTKPFAILCADLNQARKLAFINQPEQDWLTHPAAPVVLLNARSCSDQTIRRQAIAPGIDTLGIMLPNAPLLECIARQFQKPLVCTSGNSSGAPIFFRNQDAIEGLNDIADLIAIHDRDILMPQDDSVIKIVPGSDQPIILRRARGLAPYFTGYRPASKKQTLATGALVKSSFAIQHADNIYISQYLGDTDSYEAQQSYRHSLQHMLTTLNTQPDSIASDIHPGYFSTSLARQQATQNQILHEKVQHHKAHFAAVLAENHLLHEQEDILGIIWDGTGYGDDGTTWGGESFIYRDKTMTRTHHLKPFPVLLGDNMARQPRLSALAIGHQQPNCRIRLRSKFQDKEWRLYTSMLNQTSQTSPLSSSMGRLVDAVACILGLCDRQSYEGEAAMFLEYHAQRWLSAHEPPFERSYFPGIGQDNTIDTTAWLEAITTDVRKGRNTDLIAARFHTSLVIAIKTIATHSGCKKIACSGGVFQNVVLVKLLQQQKDIQTFFHRQLSPNDENIAFGQLVYIDNQIDQEKQTTPCASQYPEK